MSWLIFVLMAVAAWGCYGVLLHTGQLAMGDPVFGRYKAYFFVGVAYMLTAMAGSAVLLWIGGASWSFSAKGAGWSTAAGIAGALGALGVLLAFGARGTPSVVMSLVFAGAPVVNAALALAVHPPPGGPAALRWPFVLGILLAALGGFLVTLYRPGS